MIQAKQKLEEFNKRQAESAQVEAEPGGNAQQIPAVQNVQATQNGQEVSAAKVAAYLGVTVDKIDADWLEWASRYIDLYTCQKFCQVTVTEKYDIHDVGQEILMLDHVKYNFWTIPIGKVEPNQTIEQGLKQEMIEELNITPTRIKKIHQFKRSYRRRGDKITVHAHMFLITRWSGSLRNNEPKKHRTIKWMSIKEIKQQRISDNTKEMLRILKNGKRLS